MKIFRLSFLVAFFFLAAKAFSQGCFYQGRVFNVDDIWYTVDGNTLNSEDREAGVDHFPSFFDTDPGSHALPGDFIIPEFIEFTECRYCDGSSHPSNFGSYHVTKILQGAFNGWKDMTSLSLPSSIKSFGGSALAGCSGLQDFEIPPFIEEIWDYAFSGANLTNIVLPKTLSVLGKGAFGGIVNLETVTFEDGLTEMGEGIFINCYNLKSVKLPSTLESMRRNTFDNCDLLESINIPTSMTGLMDDSFGYMRGLKYLTVEDNEHGINLAHGNFTFSKIEKLYLGRHIYIHDFKLDYLEDLTIGKLVKDANIYDFSLCEDLHTINCLAITPPEIGEFSEEQYKKIKVSVPNESLKLYQVHPIWKKFWDISYNKENEDTGVENLFAEPDSKISIYTPEGMLIRKNCDIEEIKSLSKGIYIIVSDKQRYKISI